MDDAPTQAPTAARGRFTDRVALVTGAARGQGRVHAVRFAQEGADVIAIDLADADGTTGALDETARLVEEAGRRAVVRAADVRDAAGLATAVAEGVEQLGRLDVAVANAGIFMLGGTLEISPEQWQRTLDVNLTGVWHTCNAALPHLLRAGRGSSIVIVGSVQSLSAANGAVAYTTSKHGTVGLMKSLAVELADRWIRVNSVNPTIVHTPMLDAFTPAGLTREEIDDRYRPLNALPIGGVECEDISNAILFLASEEARCITGVALPVDAGALLVGGVPREG